VAVVVGIGRREQAKAERRLRIMAAARDLIRETGDTNLSMRTIAKRAKVSLATPYNLFGSKRAVVLAVLEDERDFAERFASLRPVNSIDHLFQALALAVGYYTDDPDFYLTLWKAMLDTNGKEGGGLSTPQRRAQSHALWRTLLERAQRDGSRHDRAKYNGPQHDRAKYNRPWHDRGEEEKGPAVFRNDDSDAGRGKACHSVDTAPGPVDGGAHAAARRPRAATARRSHAAAAAQACRSTACGEARDAAAPCGAATAAGSACGAPSRQAEMHAGSAVQVTRRRATWASRASIEV